jgi:predicted hydrolase (HD superfamily)
MCATDSAHNRDAAWKLLTQWTGSENLRKHALAVEACVVACGEAEADRLGLAGDDRDALIGLYSTTALLHDFDYERHPTAEEHPFVGVRELERLGWPEAMRTAILGHAHYTGVPRETHLAKALFACDELAGFLTACALVKPTKKIQDVEVPSVRKKNEGQGIRKGCQPAGCDSRRTGAGSRSRRTHRILHRGDEKACRCAGAVKPLFVALAVMLGDLNLARTC